MLHLKNYPTVIFSVTLLLLIVTGCKKSSSTTTTTTTNSTHGAGWTGKDDPTKVPQAVNIAGLTGASPTLPSKVDLTAFLPPIGDQGQTGTCVAWATAYYGKTASEAIANNTPHANLSSTSFQMSPRDMFLAIPDNLKGVDCLSGTQITDALDVLVSNGVATWATAPWEVGISDCSQSQLQPSWATDAANHKIVYYRTIPATVQGIKEQLAASNPVLMGIKESDEFKNYKTGVISSSTFTGPIGLHAQCIVGYDDNEGAFRVVNSWGQDWGDNGFYWVAYNTLVNDLIANGNVYYMSSSTSANPVTPPTTTTTTSSVDIAAWVFSDASTLGDATDNPTNDPTARKMWLNIYNIGQGDVDPSSNWSYYYLYYNAFDANDYGIIFHDEFNTTVPDNSGSCANNNACTFNIAIPAGKNFAEVAFNSPEVYRNYFVPNTLNGYYYLVLVADPQNVLGDVNQQNNIFYTTGQLPAAFSNGVTNSYNPNQGGVHDSVKNDLEPNEANLRFSKFNTSVGEHNRNAYTPNEILSFVKAKYKSGEIRRKINAMTDTHKIKLNQLH
jgi:papain like protease